MKLSDEIMSGPQERSRDPANLNKVSFFIKIEIMKTWLKKLLTPFQAKFVRSEWDILSIIYGT